MRLGARRHQVSEIDVHGRSPVLSAGKRKSTLADFVMDACCHT